MTRAEVDAWYDAELRKLQGCGQCSRALIAAREGIDWPCEVDHAAEHAPVRAEYLRRIAAIGDVADGQQQRSTQDAFDGE